MIKTKFLKTLDNLAPAYLSYLSTSSHPQTASAKDLWTWHFPSLKHSYIPLTALVNSYKPFRSQLNSHVLWEAPLTPQTRQAFLLSELLYSPFKTTFPSLQLCICVTTDLCLSPLRLCKHHKDGTISRWLPLCPQCQEQCLAHNMCSINVNWFCKWINWLRKRINNSSHQLLWTECLCPTKIRMCILKPNPHCDDIWT